jgi:3-hydroxyisobutyrate dehydrogenase
MGIRVNAIAPGPTDTEATRKQAGDAGQELTKSMAIKRLGRPDDLVGACLFLLSDEAAWVTGTGVAVGRRAGVPVSASLSGPVGFVGLGAIGRPMARRLLAWPDGLHVHDVVPEPVAELERAGAKAAGSVADLAREVGLLCVMVRDDAQVREVVGQALAQRARGWSSPSTRRWRRGRRRTSADVAARQGVQLLDAPVSGGPMGAAEGTLAVLVGGPEAAFERVREPLGLLGERVVHAGPVGAGTRMKLARNLLHFVSFTAATEAQRLAEAAGLDLVELGAVTRHTDAITGGPGAIMHRATTAPLAPDDFWYGVFEHVARSARRTCGTPSSWPRRSRSTCRWPGRRSPASGPVSGCRRPRSGVRHDRAD